MVPAEGIEPPTYALRILRKLYIRVQVRALACIKSNTYGKPFARRCAPMHALVCAHYGIAMAEAFSFASCISVGASNIGSNGSRVQTIPRTSGHPHPPPGRGLHVNENRRWSTIKLPSVRRIRVKTSPRGFHFFPGQAQPFQRNPLRQPGTSYLANT